MSKRKLAVLAAVGAAALLAGCETTNMKMGSQDAKTVATGSAAGAATSGENSELEKCASPLGTVSLVENQNAGWYTILRDEYRLPPTANLLRLMVQQSNCFVVVERGAAGGHGVGAAAAAHLQVGGFTAGQQQAAPAAARTASFFFDIASTPGYAFCDEGQTKKAAGWCHEAGAMPTGHRQGARASPPHSNRPCQAGDDKPKVLLDLSYAGSMRAATAGLPGQA